MIQPFLSIAGILGCLGVAAGAFGAHALKTRLAPELLASFQTGVLYHLVHTLALAVVAIAASQISPGLARWSGWLFISGIALFSGSLYLLALTGVRGFGAITPVGGLCFLAGWACLAVAAFRS